MTCRSPNENRCVIYTLVSRCEDDVLEAFHMFINGVTLNLLTVVDKEGTFFCLSVSEAAGTDALKISKF